MSSTEDYLDRLLRNITGEPEPEPEPEPELVVEPVSELEPVSEIDVVSEPVIESEIFEEAEPVIQPEIESLPEFEMEGLVDVPENTMETPVIQEDIQINELPVVEEIPEIENIQIPELEEVTAIEDIPEIPELGDIEIPDLGDIDIPSLEEVPVIEEIPEIPELGDIEIPSIDEVPAAEEIPEIPELGNIEIPSLEEAPVIEEIPEIPELDDIEIPSLEEEPAVEDIPEIPELDDIEIPSLEEEPAVEEIPEIPDLGDLEIPDIAETSDSEEIPLSSEIPQFDESSASDEFSILDDIPDFDELEADNGEAIDFSASTKSAPVEGVVEDEDIASLLDNIEKMGKESVDADQNDLLFNEDLEQLLADSDDADMSEIGDILSKDENNELIAGTDEFDIPDFSDEMMSESDLFGDMDEDGGEEDSKKKKKKKEKKEKKPKKEKKSKAEKKAEAEGEEELGETEKKKGFIAKIIDALTASDDDEASEDGVVFEESALDIAREGAAENEAILNDLDEDNGKKKKKKKGKKGKKGSEPAEGAEGEDGEEGKADDQKAQKKAEKQRKKEEKKRLKKERKAAEAALPKKKLSKKKVIPICILCFSFGIVITLLAFLMPSVMDKKHAVERYQRQDYEGTYELLKGHKLNKSEQLMYDRTVTLLQEQRKLDSFNNYMLLDMKPEALNALVQGIKKYDELSGRATELDVVPELNGIYSQIVAQLQSTFSLSVEKVNQWLNIDDQEEYSYIINSYANGRGDSVILDMEADDGVMDANVTQDIDVWSNSVISAEEAEFNDSNN